MVLTLAYARPRLPGRGLGVLLGEDREDVVEVEERRLEVEEEDDVDEGGRVEGDTEDKENEEEAGRELEVEVEEGTEDDEAGEVAVDRVDDGRGLELEDEELDTVPELDGEYVPVVETDEVAGPFVTGVEDEDDRLDTDTVDVKLEGDGDDGSVDADDDTAGVEVLLEGRVDGLDVLEMAKVEGEVPTMVVVDEVLEELDGSSCDVELEGDAAEDDDGELCGGIVI